MLGIPANLLQQAEKLTHKLDDDQVLRLRKGRVAVGKFTGTGLQKFKGMMVKIFWPPTTWKQEYLQAREAEFANISDQEEAAFAHAFAKDISSRTTRGYRTSSSLMVEDVRILLEHSRSDREEFDETVRNMTAALTSPSPMLKDPMQGAESVVNKAVERKFLCRVKQMRQLQKEADDILIKAGVKKSVIKRLDNTIDDHTIKLSLFSVAREYARRAYSPPVTWDGSPNPYREVESSRSPSPEPLEESLEFHENEPTDSITSTTLSETVEVEDSSGDSLLPATDETTLTREPVSGQRNEELLSVTSNVTSEPVLDSIEPDESTSSSTTVLPEEDDMPLGSNPHNPGTDLEEDWEFKRTLNDTERKANLKHKSPSDLSASQLYPMVDDLVKPVDLPRDSKERIRKIGQLRKIDEPWSKEVINLLEQGTADSDKRAVLLERAHVRAQDHRETQKKKAKAVGQMKSFWSHRRWKGWQTVEKIEDQLGSRDNSNFPQSQRDLAAQTISKPLYYDNVQLPMNEAINRTITMLKNAYPTLANRGNAFREHEIREHLEDFLSQRSITPVEVPTTTYSPVSQIEEEEVPLPEELSSDLNDFPPIENPELSHLDVLPVNGKEDEVSTADSGINSNYSGGWDEQELTDNELLLPGSMTQMKQRKQSDDRFIPPFNPTEPPEDLN